MPTKGDRSNPSNYCPIALSSGIAKVFKTILNSHFLNHLEKNLLLSDHQYGFRKARSTGDLLSYLTHLWSSSLRDFGESFVVALDISKAFDSPAPGSVSQTSCICLYSFSLQSDF